MLQFFLTLFKRGGKGGDQTHGIFEIFSIDLRLIFSIFVAVYIMRF